MLTRLLAPLLALVALAALSPARADDLAVIIANKAYVNSHEVEYAHNDGERFADAAKRALRIPESRVVVLRDRGYVAMRSLVARDIAPRLNKRTKRLWVYYSGHGFPLIEGGRPPEPYLLPVDGDPGLLKATAIALDDFKKELGTLKRSMADGAEIVLADGVLARTAHSGAVGKRRLKPLLRYRSCNGPC